MTPAALLEEARSREKGQTLFYRALAAAAEDAGDAAAVERLNELHADEQHHLSRLTARLLEMGVRPRDLRDVEAPPAPWPSWQAEAREREAGEVAWYEEALAGDPEPGTRAVMEEILASERHHAAELRGKWMSA